MRQAKDLASTLRRIHGKGHKAYKDIQGDYDLGTCIVHIDHVQSDPFAPPSRLRVTVGQDKAAIPMEMYASPLRKVPTEDFLTRSFALAIGALQQARGSGKPPVVGV